MVKTHISEEAEYAFCMIHTHDLHDCQDPIEYANTIDILCIYCNIETHPGKGQEEKLKKHASPRVVMLCTAPRLDIIWLYMRYDALMHVGRWYQKKR